MDCGILVLKQTSFQHFPNSSSRKFPLFAVVYLFELRCQSKVTRAIVFQNRSLFIFALLPEYFEVFLSAVIQTTQLPTTIQIKSAKLSTVTTTKTTTTGAATTTQTPTPALDSIERDPCSSNPCDPLVTCSKVDKLINAAGFRCGKCPSGYKGDGFSCKSKLAW